MHKSAKFFLNRVGTPSECPVSGVMAWSTGHPRTVRTAGRPRLRLVCVTPTDARNRTSRPARTSTATGPASPSWRRHRPARRGPRGARGTLRRGYVLRRLHGIRELHRSRRLRALGCTRRDGGHRAGRRADHRLPRAGGLRATAWTAGGPGPRGGGRVRRAVDAGGAGAARPAVLVVLLRAHGLTDVRRRARAVRDDHLRGTHLPRDSHHRGADRGHRTAGPRHGGRAVHHRAAAGRSRHAVLDGSRGRGRQPRRRHLGSVPAPRGSGPVDRRARGHRLRRPPACRHRRRDPALLGDRVLVLRRRGGLRHRQRLGPDRFARRAEHRLRGPARGQGRAAARPGRPGLPAPQHGHRAPRPAPPPGTRRSACSGGSPPWRSG